MTEKRKKEIKLSLRTDWDKNVPIKVVRELLRAIDKAEKTIVSRDAVIKRQTRVLRSQREQAHTEPGR